MVISITATQYYSLPVSCTDVTILKERCDVCSEDRFLAEILFDYCSDCNNNNNMAALPQSAFAVHKIRAHMNKNTVAKVQSGEKQPDNRIYPNKKLMDYTPVKYNSKFMNAIWGNYNRYSPHNIKSNEDVDGDCNQLQPYYIAVAAYDIVKSLSVNVTGWEFKV